MTEVVGAALGQMPTDVIFTSSIPPGPPTPIESPMHRRCVPASRPMMGAMRLVVLLALAGCIEGEPDPTEMVVYGIADRGDVIISGGMIRWTDGMSAREAPLTAMPISSRETIPLADTTHHITVHGDRGRIAS